MSKLLKKKNNLLIVIALLLACCFPLVFSGSVYVILVGCYIIISLIGVSGLDILIGMSGQMSMGHSAYYCIGAYGSVLLHKYTGIPVFFTMIIAAVAGTVIGAIIAWPTTKLVRHFMSLATVAFSHVVYQLVMKSPGNVTGNTNGIGTASISIFGYQLDTYTKFFYFGLIVLVVFLVLKQNILNSRVGRAMIAVRENAHAADGMGINVRFYKIAAFALSCAFMAYSGAMFAHLTRYINPESFRQAISVVFLTMLLFGGTSSLVGPILGVITIQVLNELLRNASAFKMLSYGVILLLVVLAFPGGIYGLIMDKKDVILAKMRSLFKKKQKADSD